MLSSPPKFLIFIIAAGLIVVALICVFYFYPFLQNAGRLIGTKAPSISPSPSSQSALQQQLNGLDALRSAAAANQTSDAAQAELDSLRNANYVPPATDKERQNQINELDKLRK